LPIQQAPYSVLGYADMINRQFGDIEAPMDNRDEVVITEEVLSRVLVNVSLMAVQDAFDEFFRGRSAVLMDL
jgi:hypothetical protein